MPTYSIIIPHKNIPKLLLRCLASIPTRKDTEVIIVDDNSDSSIVDFNNFPGSNREDVKIIFDKSGKGGGYARNIGISEAQGKYIIFADADDFFNYCITDILDEYKEKDFDIAYFNNNSVDTDTYIKDDDRCRLLNSFMSLHKRGNTQKAVHLLKYKFGEPWCRIVSRNFILDNNIQFAETKVHQDTQFGYLTGFHAQHILVDYRALYCVTVREGSVSRISDPERKLTRIEVFAKKENFLRSHNIYIWEGFVNRQLAALLITDRKLFKQGVQIAKSYNFFHFKNIVKLPCYFLVESINHLRGTSNF